MDEQRTLAEILADEQQSQQAFLNIVNQVDGSTLYRSLGEQEWTLTENLVHVSNARQFFIAEVQKALLTPDARVGRTIADPTRIQYVVEHGHDSREEIIRQLVTSYDQLVQILTHMHNEDLQKHVEHVKYGPQTLAEFIQHFIVEHDQVHIKQITAQLS